MLNFEPGMTIQANQLERGDKYDQSVAHLLSTLDSEAFLIEKKGGLWTVTTGIVSEVPLVEPVIVKNKPKEKNKDKPKKKKKK